MSGVDGSGFSAEERIAIERAEETDGDSLLALRGLMRLNGEADPDSAAIQAEEDLASLKKVLKEHDPETLEMLGGLDEIELED